MSDNAILKRFGKYLLLDHLVDGGMAKICRARYLGEQADKIVAIKMVKPEFSQDAAFKKMFMDEIKVTFGLLHPNIAQTYDYGIEESQLYTAMEYVDGRNLKQFLDKLKERRFVFPVEISVYIISQVCQGLHYSHTFSDKLTGKKTCIIHRDISPHNIMMTYDGAVKVIDFGIAKSDTNSDSTQAGVIKGKLSYLAPEYLEGKKLDARYDEFAIGITLWEMLCSRKLFQAPNDIAVLKKIQLCKIPPPSSINPNVPKELDEIVMKALSKNRDQRFEDCDKFNRALIKFLYSTYPEFNATDLAYFAKELFKEDIKVDRKNLQEFGKIDIRKYIAELTQKPSASSSVVDSDDKKNADIENGLIKKEVQILDFGFESSASQKAPIASATHKTAPDALQMDSTQKIKKKVELTRSGVRPLPQGAQANDAPGERTQTGIRVNPYTPKKESSKKGFIAAGLVFLLVGVVGYFSGYITKDKLLAFSKDMKDKTVAQVTAATKERGPSSLPPKPQEVVKVKGTVVIKNLTDFDPRPQFFINNKPIRVGMLGEIELDVGEKVVLRAEKSGFQPFVTNIVLTKDSPTMEIELPASMPAASYGYLGMSRDCLHGELSYEVFGEMRKEQLPLGARTIALPVSEEDLVLYYKVPGAELERKILVKVPSENASVDLCDHDI